MARCDKVRFSLSLSTVYVELVRRASRCCREGYGIALTECCLLALLGNASGGTASTKAIMRFLNLKAATVWKMAASLEERGLLVRSVSCADGRQADCGLTEKGRCVVERCLASLACDLAPFSLDDAHYCYLVGELQEDFGRLRGSDWAFPLQGQQEDAVLLIEFILLTQGIIDAWRKLAAERGGLSLTQLRTLILLSDSEPLRTQDIADALIIERSQVSACKRRLCELGYAREVSQDSGARPRLLTVTNGGVRLVRTVLPELDEVTIALHCSRSWEGALMLEAWHSSTYCTLRMQCAKLLG